MIDTTATDTPALQVRRVAVIGAGRLGRAFALAAARAGFAVVLEDVMPANLRRAQDEYAALANENGAGELRVALTVEDAVRDADLVVDFVPDELESKLEIFSLIDRMAPPKTIVCTPTYALSISDLASCVYRPERCLAVQSSEAALAGGVLNLITTTQTSPEVLAAAIQFWHKLATEVSVSADTLEPMLVKNARP